MSLLFESSDKAVSAILHPTDRSEASQVAYHHALALGIRSAAKLTLLHATGRRVTDSWPGFPSVRDTLARWRAAGHTADFEERIGHTLVSKLEVDEPDPVAASLRYVRRHSVDLIVAGTEGRGTLSRLLRPSRAQKLAKESELRTLFVPSGARPFVDADTGEVALGRILVPVAPEVDPRGAMLFAVQLAALLENPDLEVTLLRISDDDSDSSGLSELPTLPYCRWNLMVNRGAVVDGILAVAEALEVGAILMATTWRSPAFGRVEGSVTERVIQASPCPVCAIPA